ncbi:MAG TPA: hypothetical protein VL137_09800 [Polyangiaceae bacterium]|nr:hypothetical protein [Polyangiaceae bacterium]
MELYLPTGEAARLLEYDDAKAVLWLPLPKPPGSPVMLRAASGVQLQIKVNRCQKMAKGEGFRIDARWVSLSRADRALLDRAALLDQAQSAAATGAPAESESGDPPPKS